MGQAGGKGCDGGVCQKFSQGEAFWRRFFRAVALGATEGGKWAYFELLMEINGLEGRVLTGGVKKVLGRHSMPTNKTKKEGEN